MGKWNNRSRFYRRRRSPSRWYSERHSFSSYYSGYGENDGIPVWEKRFCEVIGSVPWQKVVEASEFKSWCQGNVITWNDSACEETFHNEKKRFWSQVKGLHCDISLPDPDLYISEVDWDTFVDPELIKDLERAYFAPPDEGNSGFKRGRRDKNWSNCNAVPVQETLIHGIDALGKQSNGLNITESSKDHPKDKESPWDAKPSCVNKKPKGFESVLCEEYEVLGNPWEAERSCRKETVNDIAWGGCSVKGWEDRGWGSERKWENPEWRSKGCSREPKGYVPWKAGFVPDSAALRGNVADAGGWPTRRASESNQRNWNVKRSSDGWGRQNKERDDLYGYHSNYKYSRPGRDDHQNRKVKFSAK